jgi:hypothetical protein
MNEQPKNAFNTQNDIQLTRVRLPDFESVVVFRLEVPRVGWFTPVEVARAVKVKVKSTARKARVVALIFLFLGSFHIFRESCDIGKVAILVSETKDIRGLWFVDQLVIYSQGDMKEQQHHE